MTKFNPKFSSPVEAFQKLMKKAEKLKAETEHLVQEAKSLSEVGIKEAEELIEHAKVNWKKLVNVGTLFGMKKKTAKSKTAASKKSGTSKKKTKSAPSKSKKK